MRRVSLPSFYHCFTPLFVSARMAATAAVDPCEHYKRLGIEATSSAQEIKAAYRRRALECHPDVVSDKSRKASAEAEFRKVSESYAALSDPKQKALIDASIPKQKKRKTAKPDVATSATPSSKSKPQTSASSAFSRRNSSSSSSSSAFSRDQPRSKKVFVRRDADKCFKDAFDGRSLDEVLFAVRQKQRDIRAAEAKNNTDRKPTDRAQVIDKVMCEAAERLAAKYAKEYGHESLKHIRVIKPQGARPPPGSHMPFIPFRNMEVPDGVTAEPIPSMPPTTFAADEDVKEVVQPVHALAVDDPLYDSVTRESRMKWLRSQHGMAYNAGQLYSYQRPF